METGNLWNYRLFFKTQFIQRSWLLNWNVWSTILLWWFLRLSKNAVYLEKNKTIKGEIDYKWVTSLN